MAKEQSIKDQISAMEGWAIQAKQFTDSSRYSEAEKILRTINLQGRRLEWRGGGYGLKHLPSLEEVKQLKKKITAARAAAQTSQTSITKLSKLPKIEGKKPAEVAAIRQKEGSLKKDAGKNITILIQSLKEARAISDAEPWMNLDILIRDKENLEMFLKGEGYYKNLNWKERIESWNKFFAYTKIKISLNKINLSGSDLSGIRFHGAKLMEANLAGVTMIRAKLKEANFLGANLERANLEGANLEGANLTNANLRGANLTNANLTYTYLESDLSGAILSGTRLMGADLKSANLNGVKGLTRASLDGAKNWREAKNIPKELL